ncbi:TOM1-like protein 5 isoform X2 [Primulina huaijiensis]|uniref:TOM1-like protein 5 isoform X2 n=1 Tax=Primulina huaijiensis TaxID=1492673 RepID=UPI003CC6F7BC
MAAELVSSATSYKLTDTDWTKNIEICEVVAHDHKQAKVVIKAIKKRLGSKNSNSQLFSVTVIDVGILPILVKIVKKKSDLPVREKIFLLLDAAQTSLGGASGRFPQYFSAYFELVNAGVQFPQRPEDVPIPHSSNVNKNPPDKESAAPTSERNTPQARDENVSGSSVLEKAGTALEVLRDVLIAVDTQHPEGAKDEFTLDLVEQCSFQKQRVMHLVMTSRDEKVVSQAIELNEQLERVLRRHDALLACSTTSTPNHIDHQQTEVEEEEEAEQLFRRIRKGKACLRPEDDRDHPIDRPLGLMGRSVPSEMLHRPLIRPLTLEPQQEMVNRPSPVESKQEVITGKPVVAIPPPPAKHVEREKFFQEHKPDGSTAFNGHMRNLSLHSRNASSSRSGSMDFSD